MTYLVEQRYTTDCMVASIAMALSLPYEEVYEAAITCGAYKSDHSVGICRESDILKHLGLQSSTYVNGKAIGGDFRNYHKDWAISPEFFRSRFWGRPTILTVPSLNKKGGHHAVFYDGWEVFDPNPPTRLRYASDSFEELLPSEVVIFLPNISSILTTRREVGDIDGKTAKSY